MTNLLDSAKKYIDGCVITEEDIIVREVPIWRYSIALSNNIEMLWDKADFRLAEEYKDRIIMGEEPPAIIASKNGVVHDGFHRLYAQSQLGRRFVKVIHPEEIAEKVCEAYGD
jgi:hypothetical protein